MKDNKIVQEIENNYDNLGILKIVKYLLGVVINDVEYMNDLEDETHYHDLGNNYVIEKEDFESIVSIMDTLWDIIDYNDYEKEML